MSIILRIKNITVEHILVKIQHPRTLSINELCLKIGIIMLAVYCGNKILHFVFGGCTARFIKGLLFYIIKHNWRSLTFLFTNTIASGSINSGVNGHVIGVQRHDITRVIGGRKRAILWSRNRPKDHGREKNTHFHCVCVCVCDFVRYISSFVSAPNCVAVNNYLSEITHWQIEGNKRLSLLCPIKKFPNGKNNSAILMYRDNHNFTFCWPYIM